MSDTPLFEATLSDRLQQARRDAERALQERVAEVERAAAQRVAEVERAADSRVQKAERRAAQAQRQAQVRDAAVTEEEPFEREAPPVPSVAELMRPMPGINRFLDALLGVPEP